MTSSTRTAQLAPAGAFAPRTSFSFPSQVPSWYAGHMRRAMLSLPSLLARHPPPLVIEARDARLPLTSINPAFDQLLRNAPASEHLRQQKGKDKEKEGQDS